MKLTPELRRIIYVAVVLVGLVLAAFNLIKADDVESIATVVGLLLGSGGLTLAASKIGDAPDAKTTNQRVLEAVDYVAEAVLDRITNQHAGPVVDDAPTERIAVQPAPTPDLAVTPRTHL